MKINISRKPGDGSFPNFARKPESKVADARPIGGRYDPYATEGVLLFIEPLAPLPCARRAGPRHAGPRLVASA